MRIGDLPKINSGIKQAHQECQLSDHPDHPVGAAIMINGKIISSGCNQGLKTHTYVMQHGWKNGHQNNKTLHAELAAIFKVKNKKNLKGATIFVYRQTKSGTFGMARPCCMCMDLIRHYGIKKVIYTTEHGLVEEKVTDNSVNSSFGKEFRQKNKME